MAEPREPVEGENEEDEDDFSDLPPGPHLKPMTMTPARRKVIEQMEERLAEREQREGDQ